MDNVRFTLKQLDFLYSKLSEGVAYCQIITDDAGKPIDWVYLDVNEAYQKITGLKRGYVVGKRGTEVLPKLSNDPADWISLYGKVALTGESISTERFAGVRDKWFHISVYSPQKCYFFSVFEDITERKKTEEELREANEDWELTFHSVPDFMAIIDTNNRIVRMNKSMAKQLGVTTKEAVGLICFECIHGLSYSPDFCPHAQLLKDGKQHTAEVYEPHLGGYFIVSATPLHDKNGKLVGSVHVARDITDRKRVEEFLKESEQRWSTTLSSIGDAVIATDTEGNLTFMNAVAEKLTGWTLEESKGNPVKQVFQIIDQKTRKEVESPVEKVLANGIIMGLANHTILIRKDGTEVPIDDSGAPITTEDGTIRGVVLVFRDITERKKTEDAIQRQASLIDLSPDAIIVRKVDGTITFWSRGAEKLYGWSKVQAIGKSTHELLKTQFPTSFEDIVSELKTKHEWTGEVIQHRKDGRTVAAQTWWLAEKTEHGQITSILESNVDITDRKKAEREIARLATYPKLNPNPIVEVDLDGKITYANPATKLLFPDLEKTGLNHVFFLDWGNIRRSFKGKSTNAYSRELKISGHWYQQQFYVVPQDEQIRIYITDIDDLKQTELAHAKAQAKLEENALALEEYASQMEELAEQRAQQLQSSERLAAIGQTAGMVGHDIRNPLQAITSDMYIISEEVQTMPNGESKQAILESVESVNQNLTYINKIVSDLQDYTRPLRPNIQSADLAELITGTILTINVPKNIEVKETIKAQLISTDVAYMRRILTNLITNAIQAMTEGGKLSVKASRIKNHIVVTIRDTGIGIPHDARAKMFTPLFTTKSKGQGLGLAVVKRLVEALGGTITFESHQNSGTEFILHFPLNAPEEPRA